MTEETEPKPTRRRCVTCHYACDCREALFEERRVILERKLAEMTEQRDAAMATLRTEKANHERELAEAVALCRWVFPRLLSMCRDFWFESTAETCAEKMADHPHIFNQPQPTETK